MRAVQLYNECAPFGACGLSLVPCCLPPALKRKGRRLAADGRRWRRLYRIGECSFDAREIEAAPLLGESTGMPVMAAAAMEAAAADIASSDAATTGAVSATDHAVGGRVSDTIVEECHMVGGAMVDDDRIALGGPPRALCESIGGHGGVNGAAPRFSRYVHLLCDCVTAAGAAAQKRCMGIPLHRTKQASGNYQQDWYIFARRECLASRIQAGQPEIQEAIGQMGAPVVEDGWSNT